MLIRANKHMYLRDEHYLPPLAQLIADPDAGEGSHGAEEH